MFLMISTPPPPNPLLIKLLITSGCYRRRGDIPQVLSAARPSRPENLHRGESRSPAGIPAFFSGFVFFLQHANGSFHCPHHHHHHRLHSAPLPYCGTPALVCIAGGCCCSASPPSLSFFFSFQLSRNEDQAWATRLFHKVLLCQQAHQLSCLKFYHRHGRRISAAPQKPTQPGPAPVEPEVTQR